MFADDDKPNEPFASCRCFLAMGARILVYRGLLWPGTSTT